MYLLVFSQRGMIHTRMYTVHCMNIKSGHDPFVFSITFYGALWEGLTKQYGGGIGQYNIQVLILYSGSIKG
jgi:hypothetical protein